MKSIRINDLLLKNYLSDKISHFYLVNNTDQADLYEQKLNLESWINLLLNQIIKNYSKTSLENHPDILIIGKDKDQNHANLEHSGSNYQVEDLSEINKFISHKAIELPYKIVVIFHAHKLSEIIQNKLLKALEEPENKTIFFVLNPNRKKLLATVESRAITLRVRPSNELNDKDIVKRENDQNLKIQEIVAQTPLHLFLEKYKNKENEIIKSILSSLEQLSTQKQYKAIEMLKWFEKSKAHNNSVQQRLTETYILYKNN